MRWRAIVTSCRRALFAWALALSAAAAAATWPERPDPSFGTGGELVFDSVDTMVAQLWAVAADRLLVRIEATNALAPLPRDPRGVAGLWRLGRDGTPDASFGDAGHVVASAACLTPCGIRSALPVGEHIYVVEGSEDRTPRSVRRLRGADGTLDGTWGEAGTARGFTAFPRFVALAMAPGPAGSVVVAGVDDPTGNAEIAVVRIAAQGEVDRSFGVDGFATTGLAGAGPVPVARVLANGGVLVLHGDRLARLDAAGRRDPSFGSAGIVELLPVRLFASDVVVDSSGRALVVGSRNDGGPEPELALLVVALRPDGAVDAGYGTNGIARVTTDRRDDDALGTAVVLDAQGRLVVAGYAGRASYSPLDVQLHRAVVARLLPGGAPDLHFAPGGATAFWSGLGSEAFTVAPTHDGRVIVGGTSHLAPVRFGKSPDYQPRAAVFALAGGASVRARPEHESATFEFVHAGFGHYFLTTNPDEVRKLDTSADWTRTGQRFNVWPKGTPGRVPVCRFWSAQRFAPKSSHFHTPYDAECKLLQRERTWDLEGAPFALRLPEGVPGTRTCPIDSQPLYRAYNDGAGGAPNHRYTIDVGVLDAMVARGWVVEGEAETRVLACAPLQ